LIYKNIGAILELVVILGLKFEKFGLSYVGDFALK
jgi:hypothetical protein